MLAAFLLSWGSSGRAWARPEGEVRVAVREAPPFAWRDTDGKWSGLVVDLWRRVAEQADLPRSVYQEQTLERLLDAVAVGEADVGLGALSVTAAREARLDFTHPYFSSGLGVAVSTEDDGDDLWGLLASLWARGLGWLLGGLIVGLLVVGFLITWAERRRNPLFRDGEHREALGLGLWWATVMSLGHKGVVPQTLLGRFLAAGLMATSLLLLSVFVGAIASILTISRLEERIRGPEDLRQYRIATVAETTSEEFLARERILHRAFDSVDEALAEVIAGRVDGIVYDRPLLLYLAKGRFRDRLRVLQIVIESEDYAIALSPGHPHREAINRALLAVRSSRWWRQLRFQYLGQ